MTSPDGRFRWVSPPNWPAPPAGWKPEPGWKPDPAWGPAPEGWEFWQPVQATSPVVPSPAAALPSKYLSRPAPGILHVRGHNGQITWDGTFITIHRAGAMGRITVGKGDKRIPLGSISAVQLKPAGIVLGFISFSLAGGVERRSKFGRQTQDANTDENSVMFRSSMQPAFETLRAEVEQAIAARHAPQQVIVAAAPPDLADQLAKLADLRDRGVLSEDEFASQKARLLG